MRKIAFLPKVFNDFQQWAADDRKIYRRIVDLIKDIEREPFTGIGKPEPLKHELSGLWARRITNEHRLIYKVSEDEVVIVSCKFHY